mmetsp:Transcript_54229/g.141302  ORF Transcript_54229/g.141302 Transcript_54229/m.141302 type:complete len:95 (-) Transcript_54229:272-556(-)
MVLALDPNGAREPRLLFWRQRAPLMSHNESCAHLLSGADVAGAQAALQKLSLVPGSANRSVHILSIDSPGLRPHALLCRPGTRTLLLRRSDGKL